MITVPPSNGVRSPVRPSRRRAHRAPLALYKGLNAILPRIMPKMTNRFASSEKYKTWLAHTGSASVGVICVREFMFCSVLVMSECVLADDVTSLRCGLSLLRVSVNMYHGWQREADDRRLFSSHSMPHATPTKPTFDVHPRFSKHAPICSLSAPITSTHDIDVDVDIDTKSLSDPHSLSCAARHPQPTKQYASR